MYIEKLKFFQEIYPKDTCIAGITTSAFNDMSVGTPCIAIVRPFTIYDGIGNRSNSNNFWGGSISSTSGLALHGSSRPRPSGRPRSVREANQDVRESNQDTAERGVIEATREVARSRYGEEAAPGPDDLVIENQENAMCESLDRQENTMRESLGRYMAKKITTPKLSKDLIPNETKKSTAKDIYQIAKEDLPKANNILSKSLSSISVVIPFSIWSDSIDYVVNVTDPKRFHMDGSLPIIYDNGTHTEISRLSDVHNTSDVSNFPDILAERLQRNRFINYTFTGVGESNLKYMLEDINSFYNVLTKAYPNHISFFQYPHNRVKVITDVVSVSFYELGDVLPIFDSKRAVGICMEVFITNSLIKGQEITSKMKSATYRFVFSKSKENVFTIDGEAIRRPHDKSSSKAIGMVRERIAREVPNDANIKNNKSKVVEEEV